MTGKKWSTGWCRRDHEAAMVQLLDNADVTVTKEQVRDARLTVADRAKDADDLTLLLDVLGIGKGGTMTR